MGFNLITGGSIPNSPKKVSINEVITYFEFAKEDLINKPLIVSGRQGTGKSRVLKDLVLNYLATNKGYEKGSNEYIDLQKSVEISSKQVPL